MAAIVAAFATGYVGSSILGNRLAAAILGTIFGAMVHLASWAPLIKLEISRTTRLTGPIESRSDKLLRNVLLIVAALLFGLAFATSGAALWAILNL